MVAYKSYKINGPLRGAKVLVIYTGGTLGMVFSEAKQSLVPFPFEEFLAFVPEVKRVHAEITVWEMSDPIDSSNMNTALWGELALMIGSAYPKFDAFVILHGTDTMAYTASAMSFMLENLQKPVIFTGAQLPIGIARTDARENLITSLELAALATCKPLHEVLIYFNGEILRGNRSKKHQSEQFDAFVSENYPVLGRVGVNIQIYEDRLIEKKSEVFKVHSELERAVGAVKLFPGFDPSYLNIDKRVKGIVLETFGAGNAPTSIVFEKWLKQLISDGVVILNISQCTGGAVDQKYYETGRWLEEIGVISGGDMTFEAAITKLMYLLSKEMDKKALEYSLRKSLVGEKS